MSIRKSKKLRLFTLALLQPLILFCQSSEPSNPFMDPITQVLYASAGLNQTSINISFDRIIAKPGDTIQLNTSMALSSIGGLDLFLDPEKGLVPFDSFSPKGNGIYELKIRVDVAPGLYSFPIKTQLASLQRDIVTPDLKLEIDAEPPSLSLEFQGKFDVSELSLGSLNINTSEEIESLPDPSQILISGSAKNTLAVSQVLRSGTKSIKLLLNGVPGFEGGSIDFQFPTIRDKAGNETSSPKLSVSAFGFRAGANMNIPRRACAAIELRDGRGLITGGTQNAVTGQLSILPSTEFYDPTLKRFTFGPSFNVGRREHQVTLLPNGEVFASAGWGPQTPGTNSPNIGLVSTEIFNPSTNQWRMGPNLKISREKHSQSLLPDGSILVSGGTNNLNLADARSVERINLSAGTSTVVGTMSEPRRGHLQIPLKDGRVLLAGGEILPSVPTGSMEVFDPTTNSLTVLSSTIEPRFNALFYELSNGNILILGGFKRTSPTDQPVFTIELVEFPSLTVKKLSNLNLGRLEGSAFLLPFGPDRFNISGGRERNSFYDAALPISEVWNPVTESSVLASTNIVGRMEACSYSYAKGGGLVIGGRVATILRSTEEYTSE